MSSPITIEPESSLNDPRLSEYPYKIVIQPPELSFYTALGISVLYRLSTVSKGMQREVRWKILEYTKFELNKPNIEEDIIVPDHIKTNASKIEDLVNLALDEKTTIAQKWGQFKSQAIIICRAFQRILAAIFAKSNKIPEAKDILADKPVNYSNIYYFRNFAVSLSLRIVVRTPEDDPIESIDETNNDRISVDIYCANKRTNHYFMIKHLKDVEFLQTSNPALINDLPFVIVRKKVFAPKDNQPNVPPSIPPSSSGMPAGAYNPAIPPTQVYPQGVPFGGNPGQQGLIPSGVPGFQTGYPGQGHPGYLPQSPSLPGLPPGNQSYSSQPVKVPSGVSAGYGYPGTPGFQGQPVGPPLKVPSGGLQLPPTPPPPPPPPSQFGPPGAFGGPPQPPPFGVAYPPKDPLSPAYNAGPKEPPPIDPLNQASRLPVEQLDQSSCEVELTNYLLTLLNASSPFFTKEEVGSLKKLMKKLKSTEKNRFSRQMKETSEKFQTYCKSNHSPQSFVIFKHCGQRHCRECLASSSQGSRIICECRQDVSFEDMAYLLGKQINCSFCRQPIEDISQAVIQGEPVHKSCFIKSFNS